VNAERIRALAPDAPMDSLALLLDPSTPAASRAAASP
jgi:hypothetical protein